MVQAEVAHHGRDHGVVTQRSGLTQRQGANREQLVTVDHRTIGVDGQAAVGVSVVRDAKVRAGAAHRLDEVVEVRRADPVVDVQPVRLRRDRRHLRARAAIHLWGDRGSGAVRAVHDDVQAVEAGRLRAEQVRERMQVAALQSALSLHRHLLEIGQVLFDVGLVPQRALILVAQHRRC